MTVLSFVLIISFAFYDKDGHDNIFDDNGRRVYGSIEGVLTDITDKCIILETITSRIRSRIEGVFTINVQVIDIEYI